MTTLSQIPALRLPISNGQFQNNEVVLDTPVVLAPMAGITNSAFRTLCREQGAGLFVSEMVTARALIERHPETMRLITPGVWESPRSVQLYAVDPVVVGQAITMLMEENLADHIDLNFGCPVPKVTRRGVRYGLFTRRARTFAFTVNRPTISSHDRRSTTRSP